MYPEGDVVSRYVVRQSSSISISPVLDLEAPPDCWYVCEEGGSRRLFEGGYEQCCDWAFIMNKAREWREYEDKTSAKATVIFHRGT